MTLGILVGQAVFATLGAIAVVGLALSMVIRNAEIAIVCILVGLVVAVLSFWLPILSTA